MDALQNRFTAIRNALEATICTVQGVEIIEKALMTLAGHPEVLRLAPEAETWRNHLAAARVDGDTEEQEYALLELYRTLHTAGAGYTEEEKKQLDEQKGLHGLSGGLLPLLMTKELVSPDTCMADLGAGNGLQGLLLQCLCPHRHTLQVELSKGHLNAGRLFQRILGIADHRVSWRHGDLFATDLSGVTLLYLYRPVRPSETTLPLYRKLAATIGAMDRPIHLVSVADCLTPHLDPPVSPLYDDGFVTITAVEPRASLTK
ncbi:hypothetical protein [Desulfoluna butyratoxydans]|uniref:S-adenosyl-l-methionine-dependent methyltransferase n=1 Tax=Desulfoluna butyratoxydans TaxID=231438 RepID=A0A4U8YML9_9BACT|nr:hypothetical protein [Desulfoluna butyratoxydans]VFQ42842.1 s-adenosyl-l-methionine-dependent methyltransferase [Desulfoluna butyratoxydans]